MRIVIEIDGKEVLATELSHPAPRPASGSSASVEAPAALLETARALGAQSAGPAAFARPAGAAAGGVRAFATTPLADRGAEGADVDAGGAAAVTLPASAPPGRATGKPARKRRSKRA